MIPSFTVEEMKTAARKLGNNEVKIRDEVHEEFIEYGSGELYQ